MLNFNYLHIVYANPVNQYDECLVKYKLRDTPITQKWVKRVLLAQKLGYPIDNPSRFYGFGSVHEQEKTALWEINGLIKKLQTQVSIDRTLTDVRDQDTLNYLHHIFEIEHGLLDVKNSESEFQQNLSNLNILVHKCESIARGAHPRHVVTYYGLPKTEVLCNEDYQYFESKITVGTVYINYVEIGKTLFDLMVDNDSYIKPEAFQPFLHYSADFVVKFWDDPNTNLQSELYKHYQQHEAFFNLQGYTWENLSRSIGGIPVADIDYTGDVLKELKTRQFVKAVEFS
jgi:hypothetical protein